MEFHTEYSYQNKIKRKKFNKKKERGEFTTQLILYSNSCKEIILGDIKLGGGEVNPEYSCKDIIRCWKLLLIEIYSRE